eukprot:GHUV01012631.1.p1 GENE.GHUV01012631.1~~GHUV01012631.1.p1  ORF type:complete len:237 (-),score=37.06 GHUV01012631.1:2776-3486(-)
MPPLYAMRARGLRTLQSKSNKHQGMQDEMAMPCTCAIHIICWTELIWHLPQQLTHSHPATHAAWLHHCLVAHISSISTVSYSPAAQCETAAIDHQPLHEVTKLASWRPHDTLEHKDPVHDQQNWGFIQHQTTTTPGTVTTCAVQHTIHLQGQMQHTRMCCSPSRCHAAGMQHMQAVAHLYIGSCTIVLPHGHLTPCTPQLVSSTRTPQDRSHHRRQNWEHVTRRINRGVYQSVMAA